MGYPAQISGADDDPVMQAIRAKFAQQQQQTATRAPTQLLPEHVRAAAMAAVRAQNGNARNVAVNSQIAAMHSDPAIMQQIMETYGPDMAAQYAGGGNGAVQQPQAIQRAIPTAAESSVEEAAEGLSSSPQEEVAEAHAPSATGNAPSAPVAQPPATGAPTGIDPTLAAALGLTSAAAGGAAGYFAGRAGRPRAPAAPTMRGAVPGDFDAPMPPPNAAAAATPAPKVDPRMQAAIMGDGVAAIPDSAYASAADFNRQVQQRAIEDNKAPSVSAPVEEIDESGIPEHMRSNVDSRSRPNTRRTQQLAKMEDMGDAHIRSIVMGDAPPADTSAPDVTEQAPAAEAAQPEQAAPAKRTRKSTKKTASAEAPTEGATETAKPAKAKRSSGKRTASATPNAEGGTDYVHTDAKTARAAIAASKAKKAAASATEQDALNAIVNDTVGAPPSLADKVTKIAEDTAPEATQPAPVKKARKPRTPKAKAEAPAATPAPEAQTLPEAPQPELRKKTKSRLDVPTGPGAKASKGMTLAEAKELVKAEPSLEVIDKFKAYDMNDAEYNALKEQAKSVIRAAKGAAPGNPKAAKTAANAEQTFKESKNQRTVYTYDDKDEAILKAMKEPVVMKRPMRKQDANRMELLKALARKRK